MSRKSPDPRPEPGITEAAENAELRIRVLQSRLAATEDLEWELQKYFAAQPAAEVSPIRERVIDGVVDRILRGWEDSPLEKEIVARLIERIFERITNKPRE